MSYIQVKKELVLHIGLHKTGTSAIQKFLGDNHKSLEEQGILYPLGIVPAGDHNPLAWCLTDERYFPNRREFYVENASVDYWSKLYNVVSRNPATRIILSGEDFSLIDDPGRLAELCKPFDTRVIVYLRRQDQYIQSVYNQMVKSYEWSLTKTFEEFLGNHHLGDIIHYDRLLKRWSEAFGKERIQVGVYDKSRLPRGLIVDFASRAGIHLTGNMRIPNTPENRSLPRHFLEIKRILNQIDLSRAQHEVLLQAIFAASRAQGQGEKIHSEHRLMSGSGLKTFLAEFEDGNRSVARDYLGEGSCLFPAPPHELLLDETPTLELPDSDTLLERFIGPLVYHLTDRLVKGGV